MSIAKNLVDIVTGALAERGVKSRVESISVRLGKMRAVDPLNLEFCFKVLSAGGILEEARLVIEEVSVRVKCGDCARVSEIAHPHFLCPACSSPRAHLVSGKELEVTSIEVLDTDRGDGWT